MQVPTLPGLLHAWQVPAHETLQHTPSSQLPEVHSESPPQATPLVFFATQLVPLQYCVDAHPFWSSGQTVEVPLQVSAMVSQFPAAARHT
jgi:hypothetical protein